MTMPNSTVITPTEPNKNLYNGGSELQDDLGGLPDLMQTYYRNYDAALGRWTGVDPQANVTDGLSPYQYANNNPIMFNDPMGDLSQAQLDDVIRRVNDGIKDGKNYYYYEYGSDSGLEEDDEHARNRFFNNGGDRSESASDRASRNGIVIFGKDGQNDDRIIGVIANPVVSALVFTNIPAKFFFVASIGGGTIV